MIRVSDVKLYPGQGVKALKRLIFERLSVEEEDIRTFRIVRQSVDARDKNEIRIVWTVEFSASPALEAELLSLGRKQNGVSYYRGLRLSEAKEESVLYCAMEPGEERLAARPVVIGFGPCGIFAALILAEAGYRPIVLERGKRMDERIKDVEAFWNGGALNPESNVQFGEGGAGTFSDGKLTTGTHDPRIGKVLEELAKASGRDEIRYMKKPHIGTDELRTVVTRLRERIEALGGEIRFGRKVTGWTEREEGERRISALTVENVETGETEGIETQAAIFALGHSARDAWRTFYAQGLYVEPKPFSMGVRAEHLQRNIDIAQYGRPAAEWKLEPADYKLAVRVTLPEADTRGVYTFCMCPGGTVVAASSEEGTVVTNGMSNHDRAGKNANSAVLVDVRPEDYLPREMDGTVSKPGSESYDPLSGVSYQEKYERLAFLQGGGTYAAPAETLGDFLAKKTKEAIREESEAALKAHANEAGREKEQKNGAMLSPTYARGVTWTDLSECLPPFVTDALRAAFPLFGRRVKGFASPDTILTGVETRSSSPVRILRGEDGLARVMQEQGTEEGAPLSPLDGFYPAGEGAGYAGGIVSAAVDGIRQAEAIIRRYARP